MSIYEPIRIDEGDGVWPPEGYTGKWAYHWPNGKVKYRASYVNGETDGEVVCFWENGRVAQRGISANGRCCGTWTDYDEDGTKTKETKYEGNDDFTVTFWSDGRVTDTQVWVNGKRVE